MSDSTSSTPSRLQGVWVRAGVITALVFFADQLAKTVAVDQLADGPRHVVGPFNLVLFYNPGVAFGIGSGFAPYLVVAAILVIVAVMIHQRANIGRGAILASGLVLGGALGNMVDRLFRSPGGKVVDFIQVGWWPIFNLADAAVVVGAFTLAFAGARSQPSSEDDEAKA